MHSPSREQERRPGVVRGGVSTKYILVIGLIAASSLLNFYIFDFCGPYTTDEQDMLQKHDRKGSTTPIQKIAPTSFENPSRKNVQLNNNIQSGLQCLGLDDNQEMESLIANARQIFVTMPAKAGGTSMKAFTKRCMKKSVPDNILSLPELWSKYLADSLHFQSIISSHLLNEDSFIRLVNSPSRESLMIHTHREESSRLVSAVKEISQAICAFTGGRYSKQQQTTAKFKVRKNNTHCILDENSFLNDIAANAAEVGFSTHRLLTCQSYKAIHDNANQLVFLHYKQVDKLQKLLAKHHCPEMLDELPVKENDSTNKSLKVLLHKKGTEEASNSIELEEWLHAKGPALEWTLQLRRKASCQAKTFHMEDELFACPDETLKVTSASIDRW